MSVQYRSRIRTVVDYGVELSDLGCCCYPPEHEEYSDVLEAATDVSYQECVSEGGYFIACDTGETATCPDLASTGCCCACSYVDDFGAFLDAPGPNYPEGCPDDPNGTNDPRWCYQGGIKDVTYCECNDLNGRWSPLPCTEYYDPENLDGGWQGVYVLCDPPSEHDLDVRFPDACCIPPEEEGGLATCVNVCSPQECIDAAGGTEDVVYYEGQNCGNDFVECGNSSGGRNVKRYKSGLIIGNLLDNTSVNEKSCCIIDNGSSVLCKSLVEEECLELNGIWAGLNEHSQALKCSDTRCSDLKNYIENKKTEVSSAVVDSWYIGQKVLDIGVYVGDFNIKSRTHGDSPICFGNQNTGMASEYKPESYENSQNSENTYAVILAPSDIAGVVYDNKNKSVINKTSMWDTEKNHTLFNRDFNLTKMLDQRGDGWRVASLDLWSFIVQQLRDTDFYSNLLLKDKNPMLSFNNIVTDYYWTSSMTEPIGGKSYAYIHNGTSVGLCDINMKKHRVRPVKLLKKK